MSSDLRMDFRNFSFQADMLPIHMIMKIRVDEIDQKELIS